MTQDHDIHARATPVRCAAIPPALHLFAAPIQDWFLTTFPAGPTPAQTQAWPAIAGGNHTLISAPTGSGKTLAAFLWALDRLIAEPPSVDGAARRTRLVYLSPLKALGYDVERNLRRPLRGIGANLHVAIRTGDTPQAERRRMLREPPDILITTPESLYLMLTSQARRIFADTEWVIVDEIHAVAPSKRGAHLAISLERLCEAAARDVQRIGLSATQRPLDEVGRFLVGPQRTCTIVDAGVRKPLDLRIHVPVESMLEPGNAGADLEPLAGQEATRRSLWPAMYPELLQLVREHRSTLLFVNNRRAAERLALRLNELAGKPVARAHHGSLAREERQAAEDLLKRGELPCLVATSSLELGIDMGAVDLVIQIESPKSVTHGLQRIGRAGHGVGAVSKGRIFPKFRADLLECAVVAQRMREGLVEATEVPRNPLDVLCQQIVALAVAAGEEGLREDAVLALVRRTYTYADLDRRQLENVLDMLDGRYPAEDFSELRARIVWDRVTGIIRPRAGARALAVANAGTIPDRGLFSVNLPDGRRVGELDEEMVYEARAGQTFLLGATSWRIEQITRDRVVVTPAPGRTATVPFWHGDGLGRPRELGQAIGAFARWAVDQDVATLQGSHDLDERAAANLLQFLRDQRDATGIVPSDTTVVVERFRDEIGDWRVCVLTPFGGRVHSAWALALNARIRQRFGLQSQAIWSDDGIIVHLPDTDQPPGAELVLVDPDEVHDLVVEELGDSALFGARFRENAARALLLPRALPGRRTPLWQQRLRSHSLLEVARRYPQFPLILETYRECLQDVFDMPGLIDVLRRLHSRGISLVERETATASPLASSLLFDYIAAYMYEGDAPSAERRAAALALDRDLLRELLGQEELRDLIAPEALRKVEDDAQHRSEHLRARSADEIHDLLRQLGDLTADEIRERTALPERVDPWLRDLARQRRAVALRLAGQRRWIAAEDAGLFRDALGARPPADLPTAFLAEVTGARERLVRRFARTHGPFDTAALTARYGIPATATLADLERRGHLLRGELRPEGSGREWCDPEIVRRLRRASLAILRREIEPVEHHAFARFALSWHGVDRPGLTAAGVDGLRDVLTALQALPLTPEVWEQDVLPARLGSYSPAWLDQLCTAGEVVWVGAGSLGRGSGRVALYFRDDAAVLGPPPGGREPPSTAAHEALRTRLSQGPCFFADILVDCFHTPGDELLRALWDLVWAGEVTNDTFTCLRGSRRTAAAFQEPRPRRAGVRRLAHGARRAATPVPGRWSLTADLFARGAQVPVERRRAQAELLLKRHGILTRELVAGEGFPGGFSALYDALSALETLGIARRGYFVEGLGGTQFALAGAVERLRAERSGTTAPVVLAATDPAQPYGAVLRWPDAGRPAPARQAGAHVVLVNGDPILSVERGGRALQILCSADDERLDSALRALLDAVRRGRPRRLALERVNAAQVFTSPYAERLQRMGFRAGPRRLTFSA